MKVKHPLHIEIGELLSENYANREGIELILDEACGGKQQIPLFFDSKSSENELCDVDALIMQNGRVKVIMEIEESKQRKPTDVCGKYLTSAISDTFCWQGSDLKISDKSVLFVQVIDTSSLPDKSKKPENFRIIEKLINKVTCGIIKEYKLALTKQLADKQDVITSINNFINITN